MSRCEQQELSSSTSPPVPPAGPAIRMPSRLPRHPSHRPRLCAALLVVAAAMLLAVPASASAARTKDPVLAAIAAAQASGHVSAADAVALRRDWFLSARGHRTAKTATRRATIGAVRSYTTALARRRGLTPDRLRPALLSVAATTSVMTSTQPFPRHEQELQLPGEAAVFTYYSGRGVQFQPFETFKEGLRKLNVAEPDIVAARAIADRMLQLSAQRGTSRTWEFFFPFGGPSTPWTSAISQAVATEFLYRVSQAVPAGEGAPYAAAAEEATRAFLRAPRVGGVGTPQGKGRFYVMYSFLPSQRILNGHLQVLINVNRYAAASGSKAARRVVLQGIDGVLPILPKFDTGAWSNYQPGQEAELNYHAFQTDQLIKLGDETGNTTLADYGIRFLSYQTTPPTLGFPTSLYPAIFPAADRFRDEVVVPFTIDKRSRVTLVVRDADGDEVWRGSTRRGRGEGTITWPGVDALGNRVETGSFTGSLTATDVAGNRATADLPAPLRVIEDRTAPTLRLLTFRPRGTGSLVTANAFDMASGYVIAQLRLDGKVLATTRGPRSGTHVLRTARRIADVRRAELVLRDSSGNVVVHPLTTP